MAQGRSAEIISMIKWIRTSRLSINNSLCACRDSRQNGHTSEIPEKGYIAERSGLGFKVNSQDFGFSRIFFCRNHPGNQVAEGSKRPFKRLQRTLVNLNGILTFNFNRTRYAQISGGDGSLWPFERIAGTITSNARPFEPQEPHPDEW